MRVNNGYVLLKLELWPQCSKSQLQNSKPKPKLLKFKNTVHLATFNVRILNRVNQLPKLTASATENDIDIICTWEHRDYHSELEIKYHDTGNGWTFASVLAWKNSVNAVIEDIGMLLSLHSLKSLYSIEKSQSRMMCVSFNRNTYTTIISYYSPTNAINEMDIITVE